mgnify:FL=1
MIEFLARVFIRHRDTLSPSALRQAYGQLCGAVGIGLNLLLFVGKLFAGTISGSIAITADAFNNLSDAGSSLVTLLGFRLAGRKPDPEHPFGHGRMEYISGLAVAGLILLMGVELGKSSLKKILSPEEIVSSPLVLAILAVSVAVKLYMFYYNRSIGRKIKSAAMSATATDSLSDAVSTTAVLMATLVGQLTGLNIDGWVGLLVALFILFSAYKAAKETLSPLLGQTPDPEFVDRIEQIVLSYPEVLNIHDLIVHDYGPGRMMISLHAEVSADGDLLQLHDVIDNAEHRLKKELGCMAVIHMDPIITNDAHTDALRMAVAEKVKSIDPRLTIHDFRTVPGSTHTNLIFDVVVPYDVKLTADEVRRRIGALVKELDENYFAVVQVDNSYVL